MKKKQQLRFNFLSRYSIVTTPSLSVKKVILEFVQIQMAMVKINKYIFSLMFDLPRA